MVIFVLQGVSVSWLLFVAVWSVGLLLAQGTRRRRNPFGRRLDQLLVLLIPETATGGHSSITAFERRFGGGLHGAARSWRAPLGAVYAQGYQVASETISSPVEVARSSELVRETVEALRAERVGSGATVPTTEDPVVVLAYGLGAWPSGADLTSLEELLGELDLSHEGLRSRFESLLRAIAPAKQNREFRELAGASFVLGASARIVEAANPSGRPVPPAGWLAALRTYQRRRSA